MKERPILFSAPMVRALLNGSKTQTRRVVKLRQLSGNYYEGGAAGVEFDGFRIPREDGPAPAKFSAEAVGGGAYISEEIYCPYGQPGNRLWVRETCWIADGATDQGGVVHCADYDGLTMGGMKKRPSIHMPRWASRILLEIVSVRVERLQAITLGDICKEGLAKSIYEFRPATDGFRVWTELWESINGAGSWAANPWVWVVEFKRVTP